VKFIKCFETVLSLNKGILEDYIFKCNYRKNPKDFSREKKLSFLNTIYFMLNMVTKSLQVELNNFFDNVLKKDFNVSKQAFSEARKKIKHEAFIELNNSTTNFVYSQCEDLELWNGYRLSGIDGTVLEIPNIKSLRDEFGCSKNKSGEVARARASCIFDLLNKLVIESDIGRYNINERITAKSMIEKMTRYENFKELIILDRGYPSAEMIAFFYENSIDFLMRSKQTFSNQIIKARKKDQIIKINHLGKDYLVRVVRVMISDTEEEVLLTSILDENITPGDFKKLYFIRWKLETKYDELKNKLQIENFTGTSKETIEQDFYASIYLSNMIELARRQSDEIIALKQAKKKLKYSHKTNLNVLIGTLKDKLVLMLLEKSKIKRSKMFDSIMEIVSKSAIPIRENRQYPRKMFLIRSKYQLNKKRCL
jgi:hypothetical protein